MFALVVIDRNALLLSVFIVTITGYNKHDVVSQMCFFSFQEPEHRQNLANCGYEAWCHVCLSGYRHECFMSIFIVLEGQSNDNWLQETRRGSIDTLFHRQKG